MEKPVHWLWEEYVAALGFFVRAVDALNGIIGRATAWLVLAVVVICFGVVLARYGFDWGDIRLQESYVWLHAVIFMIGAGYTLREDGHVRVDVIYANLSLRGKAIVNLIGTLLFLVPWLLVILYFGWPFISTSWRILEPSAEPGGLPGYFILKSVIMVFAGLMLVQGLAGAARSILVLQGYEEWAPKEGGH
jgi:TRAP-type mannitol/chloroaromatic compound transport system permease small subunit